ncbi:hypothetical protein DM860_015315 [Cuscuta australis]|uniref:Uncharacterized protein n=1 Tax=Cuscuta australis TaxID=267555 RepID=A0A328DKS9_9ASTE|nr:hypothetical protein DM860_015315 [Cuscuta australis]
MEGVEAPVGSRQRSMTTVRTFLTLETTRLVFLPDFLTANKNSTKRTQRSKATTDGDSTAATTVIQPSTGGVKDNSFNDVQSSGGEANPNRLFVLDRAHFMIVGGGPEDTEAEYTSLTFGLCAVQVDDRVRVHVF